MDRACIPFLSNFHEFSQISANDIFEDVDEFSISKSLLMLSSVKIGGDFDLPLSLSEESC